MKKYTYTLALGLALVFSSCGNETNQVETEDHTEHEHTADDEALQLNKGEKWVVNDEMMVHVKNMEMDLEKFEGQDEKDFSGLATKLDENIGLLTSSCTMTGESHDELHKWLHPYIDLVSKLSAAENDAEAKETYKEIQASYKTFNTYFK